MPPPSEGRRAGRSHPKKDRFSESCPGGKECGIPLFDPPPIKDQKILIALGIRMP